MKNDLEIKFFADRAIVVKGVGKLYYEQGFPIEMSILHFKDKGIEVSVLHVADELLKNGFPPKRVIAILQDEGIEGIEKFCNATYQKQREMIFDYLFKNEAEAKAFFRFKLLTGDII